MKKQNSILPVLVICFAAVAIISVITANELTSVSKNGIPQSIAIDALSCGTATDCSNTWAFKILYQGTAFGPCACVSSLVVKLGTVIETYNASCQDVRCTCTDRRCSYELGTNS